MPGITDEYVPVPSRIHEWPNLLVLKHNPVIIAGLFVYNADTTRTRRHRTLVTASPSDDGRSVTLARIP